MMMKIATIFVILCIVGALQAMPGPSNEDDDHHGHHQDHGNHQDHENHSDHDHHQHVVQDRRFCRNTGNRCVRDTQCCSGSCTEKNSQGKDVCS